LFGSVFSLILFSHSANTEWIFLSYFLADFSNFYLSKIAFYYIPKKGPKKAPKWRSWEKLLFDMLEVSVNRKKDFGRLKRLKLKMMMRE